MIIKLGKENCISLLIFHTAFEQVRSSTYLFIHDWNNLYIVT
jgi:hypothetical protein